MRTGEMTATELTADPYTRQRLALTLTPPKIPPRVGEALLLQFVSAPVATVDQAVRPLHLGLRLDRRIPASSAFTTLRTATGSVGLIYCEAADHTAALHTGGTSPITDPDTALTAYSSIRFAGPDLQEAIAQGMTTGEVPEWTTDGTHPAPGAITVTWRTSPTRRRGASDDIIPELALAVDGVVTADRTADRWLTDTQLPTIDPVEPAFAGVYLEYARQRPTPLSTAAREQLEKMNTATEIAHDVDADSTESPTQTGGTDTIERLAIASARLELSDMVTPAHVETAADLYANMLHVD